MLSTRQASRLWKGVLLRLGRKASPGPHGSLDSTGLEFKEFKIWASCSLTGVWWKSFPFCLNSDTFLSISLSYIIGICFLVFLSLFQAAHQMHKGRCCSSLFLFVCFGISSAQCGASKRVDAWSMYATRMGERKRAAKSKCDTTIFWCLHFPIVLENVPYLLHKSWKKALLKGLNSTGTKYITIIGAT